MRRVPTRRVNPLSHKDYVPLQGVEYPSCSECRVVRLTRSFVERLL